MEIADYVNELPSSVRLGVLSSYLTEVELSAPIDVYYKSVGSILAYGTEERLNENDFIGRLLVIGVVSAAEAYFRGVLAACIELCPLAQAKSSAKVINLGGLLWHGKDGFSRTAFENTSFSSREELVKACKEFLGIKLDDTKFKSILDEYEIVCHLRHGIVHGDGLLPGKNAVQLDIPKFSNPVRITIRYMHLQDITAVISTLVLTLNRELFCEMCKRWAVDWRQRANWNHLNESDRFSNIWSIFHSTVECRGRRGRTKVTKRNCLAAVRAIYNL